MIARLADDTRLWRLRAEFWLFFLAVPVGIALFLPPRQMFPALFAATLLGIGLLALTPGFRWRSLFQGRVEPGPVLALAGLTLVTALAISWWATDGSPFGFAERNPRLLMLILLLYPFLSALPQEIVFRVLFFRRYADILPAGNPALVLNAALFSIAHLMYWSPVVALMTFFGGLAFGWAYDRRGSFPMAFVMHALAGQIIFLLGLGIFFYSGNVVRPF